MAPQQYTSASSVSAAEDGKSLSSSSGSGAQQSATTGAPVPDSSRETSSHGAPKAPAVVVPSPVRPSVHLAAASSPDVGSATLQPLASNAQHVVPTLSTGALSLDRTVACILDLDTDGPTVASTGLSSQREQAAAVEVSRNTPAGDDMTGCAVDSPASHSKAREQSSTSHADAQPKRGDTSHFILNRETDHGDASAAEDPGSASAGFDTEQEDALLAALGLDEFSDASIEEECYSDDQDVDACAEA